jgi:hypothetical protein
MSTGKTVHHADEYDMSVVISPGTGQAALRAFSNIAVMALDLSVQPWKAVIGRDILAACLLIYNGPAGSFTLAY